MAMRAVPIHPPPSGSAEESDSFAASDDVMGPAKALPAARPAESETLTSDAARGSGTATASRAVGRPEEEAGEAAQADNSKKRKAEGEARQSPEVATAVAGTAGKRRASPEAEVSC